MFKLQLTARLHQAATGGDVDTIEDLIKNNSSLSVNAKGDFDDTAVHLAAKAGHLNVIQCLQKHEADLNAVNGAGQTALHCATRAGHADVVEYLCQCGVTVDVQDDRGWTALHIACQTRRVNLAMLLLQIGGQIDQVDEAGESALHIASRENLLPVVQMLCACNCDVNMKNKEGMTALHIASKEGHAEAVRSLMLAGIDMDECTLNGVRAEELAAAHGHREVADLLSNLSASIVRDRREAVARQLLPVSKSINRVRVVIVGNSGVGKTTLVESLKCGFIRSLFRRSGAAVLSSSSNGTGDGAVSLDVMKPTPYGNNYQQPANGQYTRGIDVQQANISVAGDLSFWEFSGYEPYYVTYDRFLGDPNAIYVVVASMKDDAAERTKQLDFWMNFIRTRMIPVEPIGNSGMKLWAPRVIVVATHADLATSSVESEKTNDVIERLIHTYSADLLIERHLFTLDANQAMGTEMKQLRQSMSDVKKFIIEGLPQAIGILDSTLAVLPEWRRVLSAFPVVTWISFMEYIRSRVNLLATEEHLRELANQLQVMGEVHCIMREDQELIVINPRWLCSDIIGRLLSYDCLIQGPVGGRFSLDHLRSLFPKIDPGDVALTLDALELCSIVQRNNYTVYNLLLFDRSSAPQQLPTFADKEVVGGFQIRAEYSDQLVHVFQRVIYSIIRRLELQRQTLSDAGNDATAVDTTVEHWSSGATVTRGKLFAMVHLLPDGNRITAVICGPNDQRRRLFFFQEDVCEAIYAALETCCPALYLERAPLSVASIRAPSGGVETIRAYQPRDIVLAQLAGFDAVRLDNNNTVSEKLVDIIAFGDSEVFSYLQPGINQVVGTLPLYARYCLASLLDGVKGGGDWLKLAAALQLPIDPSIQGKGLDNVVYSPTDGSLGEWTRMTRGQATIRDLVDKLKGIDRFDVVDMLLNLTPLYRFVPKNDETVQLT